MSIHSPMAAPTTMQITITRVSRVSSPLAVTAIMPFSAPEIPTNITQSPTALVIVSSSCFGSPPFTRSPTVQPARIAATFTIVPKPVILLFRPFIFQLISPIIVQFCTYGKSRQMVSHSPALLKFCLNISAYAKLVR